MKELLIWSTVRVVREVLSSIVCVLSFFFFFFFEGGKWDLIVLYPDYCLSIHFPLLQII